MSLEHSPARGGIALSVSDPSLTVDQFCAAESMSRSMLYQAWKQGWGPAYFWIGVTRRITARARLEWQREREAEAAARTENPSNLQDSGPTKP